MANHISLFFKKNMICSKKGFPVKAGFVNQSQ